MAKEFDAPQAKDLTKFGTMNKSSFEGSDTYKVLGQKVVLSTSFGRSTQPLSDFNPSKG